MYVHANEHDDKHQLNKSKRLYGFLHRLCSKQSISQLQNFSFKMKNPTRRRLQILGNARVMRVLITQSATGAHGQKGRMHRVLIKRASFCRVFHIVSERLQVCAMICRIIVRNSALSEALGRYVVGSHCAELDGVKVGKIVIFHEFILLLAIQAIK